MPLIGYIPTNRHTPPVKTGGAIIGISSISNQYSTDNKNIVLFVWKQKLVTYYIDLYDFPKEANTEDPKHLPFLVI